MGGMVAKFWIFSDLHIDVHPYEVPSPAPDCDAIIVAGDVCSRLTKRVLPWLGTHLGHLDRPVVYVPGNHDFYGTNITDELGKARKIAAEHRITLLAEGEAAVVAGVRVVGATLWTDYALSGDRCQAMLEAEPRMNDHRRIRSGLDYRRWRPRYAAAAHARQRQAIESLLMQPIDGPTIVVTHHGPHALTLQKGHVTGHLDAAYASDLTALMAAWQPTLWVSGHNHTNHDALIGNTRLLANPRGYVLRGLKHSLEVENPRFDPRLVVDV